jgi:hypothetical protein
MLDQEDNKECFKEITLEDLCGVLDTFKKDKIPGLDGWTIDFYWNFFVLVGKDLVLVLEEIRQESKLKQAFKTTFLALIPKPNLPASFEDSDPFPFVTASIKSTQRSSLCN